MTQILSTIAFLLFILAIGAIIGIINQFKDYDKYIYENEEGDQREVSGTKKK